jgi:hypothetical protein
MECRGTAQYSAATDKSVSASASPADRFLLTLGPVARTVNRVVRYTLTVNSPLPWRPKSAVTVRLMSLLVRVMQAWERCAGSHMPQALIQSGRTGMYRVLIYHLIHHSRMHSCFFPSPLTFPSGRPKFISFWTSAHLAPSPLSPLHSALVGLIALLASVTRDQQMVFSALKQAANKLAATILSPDAPSIPPVPPAFNPADTVGSRLRLQGAIARAPGPTYFFLPDVVSIHTSRSKQISVSDDGDPASASDRSPLCRET